MSVFFKTLTKTQQPFITSIYLTATTLKCHIMKEQINLKHEETQLIPSERQLISLSLCVCVAACTPLDVHVEAVCTASLARCGLYLAAAEDVQTSPNPGLHKQPSWYSCRPVNSGWPRPRFISQMDLGQAQTCSHAKINKTGTRSEAVKMWAKG